MSSGEVLVGDSAATVAAPTIGKEQAAGMVYPIGGGTASTPPPTITQQQTTPAASSRTPRTPSSVSFAEDSPFSAAAAAVARNGSAQQMNGMNTPTHASPSPSSTPGASTTPAPPVRAGILKTSNSTPRPPLLPPYILHPQQTNGINGIGATNGINGHASALAVPSPRQLAVGVALPPTIDVALSDLHPRPLTPSPSAGSSPVPSRLLPVPMPMSPAAAAYALNAQHYAHSYPSMNGTAVSPVAPPAAAAATSIAGASAHVGAHSPKCSCASAPAFSTPAAAATHARPPLAHTPQQPALVPPLTLPSESPPAPALAPVSASLPPQFCMPPMLPNTRLLFKQLQQSSLWDRLFTHCTGRDLLAKIVQHGCGLLRCLLQLWEWAYRRLVQYAAFRRMFLRGADVKALLSPAATKAVLGLSSDAASAAAIASAALPASVASTAVATPAAPASIAIVSLLPSASATADSTAIVAPAAAHADSASAAASAAAEDDLDVFAPPSDASSFSTRLAHISYTMYRARQVLRLGRWIYDIPDVRDSALELWYGVSEEKSAETQEAEEEWEEHERVHVVRSRRASWDATMLRGADSGSSGGGGGRGTFTFPLSARTPAMSPASLSPRSTADKQGQPRGSMSVGGSAARSRTRPLVVRSASADGLEQLRDRDESGDASIASTDGSSASSSSQQTQRHHAAPHAAATAASFAGPYGDEDDDNEEEEEEDDDGPSLLEWSVGVIDFANSLMGLLIDASDDLDFIASVGLLPESVGIIAGQVSSYLWLLSGGVDVAMCCWKLHEYRCEMRETLREQIEEWRQAQTQQKQLQLQEQQQQDQQQVAVQLHNVCAMHPVPSWCTTAPATPFHLSLPPVPASAPPSSRLVSAAASSSSSAGSAAALGSLSLCSSSCDVDCVHIESLRLFRYVGELGLSLCGLVELRGGLRGDGVADLRLEAVMEASGLLSGLATFVKRGATHARSKSVVQRAESNANMQMALYS